MRRRWILIILFGIGLISCGKSNHSEQSQHLQQWMSPNGKLKVLSTIAMIDDLVKTIGGGHIDTLTLIKGDLDPHSYQLVKGDDEKLALADVIFYNGLGLEHGPSLQHYLQQQTKAIPLGNRIMADNPFLILHEKGQLDPHIWMDVSLWSRNIPVIVDSLSKKDPKNADFYRENGEKLKAEMLRTHEKIHNEILKIPESKRFLVTSHDAFNYFTKAYLATPKEIENDTWHIRFAAPEGLAPESQLSATDIQNILDHLTKYRIQVIFPESNVSKDSIRKIVQAAKEKGLNVVIANTVLYADAMGPRGSDGDSYLKMIYHNAHTIGRYLDGQND